MEHNRKNDLISIIVPIYNVGEYLEKCVSSIILQTYKDIEIILVDDGSTDQSSQICDMFKKADGRIIVCHKENQGVELARKSGLNYAHGKYIIFVDGDDYIESNMVMELYDSLLHSNADFIHSGYIRDNGEKILDANIDEIIELNCENRTQFLLSYLFLHDNGKIMGHGVCGKIYKKELIKKALDIVPDNSSYGEDLLCICACIMESNRVEIKKEAYYHYVTRMTSITNEKKVTNLVREVELYKCLHNMFCHYGNIEIMETHILNFMKNNIIYVLEQIGEKVFRNIRYVYPNINELIGKNIVIYGAGVVGQDYYKYIRQYMQCNILAVVDSNYKKCQLDYVQVESPEILEKLNYDIILVAVKSYEAASIIKEKLLELRVSEEKILWTQPCQCI